MLPGSVFSPARNAPPALLFHASRNFFKNLMRIANMKLDETMRLRSKSRIWKNEPIDVFCLFLLPSITAYYFSLLEWTFFLFYARLRGVAVAARVALVLMASSLFGFFCRQLPLALCRKKTCFSNVIGITTSFLFCGERENFVPCCCLSKYLSSL